MNRIREDQLYRERGDYGAGEYRPRPWPPVVASQRAALETVAPNRLDRLRVRTEHEPFRPLCPRCRRPYDPDSPLQAGHSIGCYQCGPDERPPQATADGPASITAQLREKEEWLARRRAYDVDRAREV